MSALFLILLLSGYKTGKIRGFFGKKKPAFWRGLICLAVLPKRQRTPPLNGSKKK